MREGDIIGPDEKAPQGWHGQRREEILTEKRDRPLDSFLEQERKAFKKISFE